MGIYPEINLPTLTIPRSKSARLSEKISPKFDWNFGEFLFEPSGKIKMSSPRESFENWCIKAVLTERLSRIAYTSKYGVELNKIATLNDVELAKSEITRTITEALMVNPRVEYVKNFVFRLVGDRAEVGFEVKGKEFETASELAVNL